MDKLRLRFTKTGRSIYMSHLDLMRTMQRAFMRAQLPLKFSEGFNPHAQISIALPMSVGVSSLCELMDFRLTSDFSMEEIVSRLNGTMPEGITALEAYAAEKKFKEIKWLRISGLMKFNNAAPDAALRDFFARDSLVVPKKTKSGVKNADIRPAIRTLNVSGGELEAVISAQEPALNPQLLIEALRLLEPNLAPDSAGFSRLEVYESNMTSFR